jgi:hypothetical protein
MADYAVERWAAGYYVVKSLLWSLAIVAVFAPLAVARFRRG